LLKKSHSHRLFSSTALAVNYSLRHNRNQNLKEACGPHTIGTNLLHRFHQLGLRHIFAILGDNVLHLYTLIEKSPIQHIKTTSEDRAGFVTDAFARIQDTFKPL
jgi:hypothetical protein